MNTPIQLSNDISSQVKVGKTVYDILSETTHNDIITFIIQAPNSNQVKELFKMNNSSDFFIITQGKRSSTPRYVEPTFL